MKRQRGRGRKPGGGGHHGNNQGYQHPNRSLESNGPEGKVRGQASAIYERYLQLGRDAAAAGDRVLAENFLQHADHYFRLYRASQPTMPVQQERPYNEPEYEGDDEGQVDAEVGGAEGASAGGEQREAEHAPGGAQSSGAERDRGEGDFRRRRGRRNRFRPGGAGDGGEGDEASEARAPREPRDREPRDREPRDREPREPREAASERRERGREQGEPRERDDGPEGFSGSPRPAFLRQD